MVKIVKKLKSVMYKEHKIDFFKRRDESLIRIQINKLSAYTRGYDRLVFSFGAKNKAIGLRKAKKVIDGQN